MKNIDEIKVVFEETPSELEKIEELLSLYKPDKKELAYLAIKFADECYWEHQTSIEFERISYEKMHSNFIIDAIKLLLKYGLDPNDIVDDENVLWQTVWIDAPNVAASLMKLLLENGADPNHFIPAESETLFGSIATDLSYDISENGYTYRHFVQCWLLLAGYGGCFKDGETPITMLDKNSVEIFKDFEAYYYEIELFPEEYGTNKWEMHVYDIKTKKEVAIY